MKYLYLIARCSRSLTQIASSSNDPEKRVHKPMHTTAGHSLLTWLSGSLSAWLQLNFWLTFAAMHILAHTLQQTCCTLLMATSIKCQLIPSYAAAHPHLRSLLPGLQIFGRVSIPFESSNPYVKQHSSPRMFQHLSTAHMTRPVLVYTACFASVRTCSCNFKADL